MGGYTDHHHGGGGGASEHRSTQSIICHAALWWLAFLSNVTYPSLLLLVLSTTAVGLSNFSIKRTACEKPSCAAARMREGHRTNVRSNASFWVLGGDDHMRRRNGYCKSSIVSSLCGVRPFSST